MRARRKGNLAISCIGTFCVLALYSVLFVELMLEHGAESGNWLPLIGFVSWALLLGGLYQVVIKDQVKELRHGIELDGEVFDHFGKKISNSDIIRAETVRFSGTLGEVLAIGYKATRNGNTTLRTILLGRKDTESVIRLRDELRRLTGLPEQTTTSRFTWADWQEALKSGKSNWSAASTQRWDS